MSSVQDPYAVLGVDKSASQDEIRRAYKKLARKYHPDVNPGDSAAEEKFKDVSAAYEMLETEEKRKLFDEFGAQAASPGFDPEQARAYQTWQRGRSATGQGPWSTTAEEVEFDLGDILGNMFGGGGRRARGFRPEDFRMPRKGSDVTTELRIPFVDAVRGVERDFSMTLPGGKPVRTKVRVPPAVKDGQKLRLRERGAEGTDGGPPGDLFITIRVDPHPHFQRDGADIHVRVPVTVKEALLGGSISVPTLEQPVKLKVPPKTQSGTKMRLRGKGGPQASGGRGDLFVELMVRVPEGGDPKALTEAAEALQAGYTEPVRRQLGVED
jgi:curved DNA-binding protein